MTLTKIASTGVEDSLRWVLGANGNSDYTFTGPGLTGTVNDPTIYLTRGHTYIFQNNNATNAHPFYIKTSIANGGTSDAYNTGVTNNGGAGGTEITFTVPHDSPDILYYQCSSHINMAGQFNIAGSVADGSITTAKLADDAVNNDKLADSVVAAIAANTAKTTNATHTGDVTGSTALTIASGAVTNTKIAQNAVGTLSIAADAITNPLIADNAVENANIANNAVTSGKLASNSVTNAAIANDSIHGDKIQTQTISLAKLVHGTSSEDGKFLRANNGADPTFETVTSTTINNNADNRVITGSGTANTLNAETALIWNGGTFSVGNAGVTEYNPSSAASTMTVGDMTSGVNRGITIISHAGGNGGLHFGDPNDDTAGAISYVHNGDYMRFFAASSQRANITQHGLTFGTDTGAANALDDYEEGTYSPQVGRSNGHVKTSGYTTQQGTYTKIGRLVHCTVNLYFTNGFGGSGYYWLVNLPFTPDTSSTGSLSESCSMVLSRLYVFSSDRAGGTNAMTFKMQSAGNLLLKSIKDNSWHTSGMGNIVVINGSLTYYTAS